MDDDLKEKVRKAMVRKNGHYMCELTTIKIGELEELRHKARMWDEVEKRSDGGDCKGCPLYQVCELEVGGECLIDRVVDSLKKGGST